MDTPYRKGRSAKPKAITAMRSAFALCSATCADGGCLTSVSEQAKSIGDNFIVIADTVDTMLVPGFVKRHIRETLNDWDDLAEDCVIGGDPEIRKGLHEIASRL